MIDKAQIAAYGDLIAAQFNKNLRLLADADAKGDKKRMAEISQRMKWQEREIENVNAQLRA